MASQNDNKVSIRSWFLKTISETYISICDVKIQIPLKSAIPVWLPEKILKFPLGHDFW